MASKDYQKHLNRLREEQQKAIKDTDDKIQQWERFRSDYDALKQRLRTLPDKLSHDVMVPFGKMGFMPGQLVHTNEILVLLGDNWFADRSAKQAADIVTRRMTVVEQQLEDLQKQRKLLEPRRDFTDDLQAMAQGERDVVDINEEYDEEKEKLWREKHKQSVVEHRKRQKRARAQGGGGGGRESAGNQAQDKQQLTDAQLWARLDELETIELREREMEKDLAEDSPVQSSDVRELFTKSSEHPGQTAASNTVLERSPTKDIDKKYTLSDEESDTSSRYLDSDDYYEEEDEEGCEETGRAGGEEGVIAAKGKVIHFSHSAIKESGAASGHAPSPASDPPTIVSPADIYANFKPGDGPTSILKKTKMVSPASKGARDRRERKRVVGFDTGSEDEEALSQVKDRVSLQDLQKAFTGKIMEKVPSVLPTSSSTNQNVSDKPVSKFKMGSANQMSASIPPREHSKEIDNVQHDSQATENVKPVSKFKAGRKKFNPT